MIADVVLNHMARPCHAADGRTDGRTPCASRAASEEHRLLKELGDAEHCWLEHTTCVLQTFGLYFRGEPDYGQYMFRDGRARCPALAGDFGVFA